MGLLPAHRLKTYRNFKAIESSDSYGIVRYFERFEDDIHALDFEENFDCTVAYTHALFEIGEFRKHNVMADHLLETIIANNITTWGGEDLYAKVLFRKATALYELHENRATEHILREILKMHPRHRESAEFLQKCLLARRPAWLTRARNWSLLLILLSAAGIAATEIFVIRPFFNRFYQLAQWLDFGLLAIALGLLAAAEGFHFWRSREQVRQFRQQCLRKKPNA